MGALQNLVKPGSSSKTATVSSSIPGGSSLAALLKPPGTKLTPANRALAMIHPGNPLYTGSSGQEPSSFPQTNILKDTFNLKNLVESGKQVLPGTTQTIKDIIADPFSVKRDAYTNLLPDMWKAIKDPIKEEATKIKALFDPKLGLDPLGADRIGVTATAIAGAGKVLFSPITALFNGANDIPVLGTLARLITVPFAVAGDAGSGGARELIKKLPISQDAKDKISPGIEEISALASQLILGKTGWDSKIMEATKTKLTKKFGATDAQTIMDKAQELAKEEAASHFPKATPLPEGFQTKPVPGEPATPAYTEGFTIKPVSDKPLAIDPLAQEARKYKSAEEFVKAQGKPVFHGSDKAGVIEKEGFKIMPLPSARGYGDGIYFTETDANAKGYGDVVKSYIPKNLKLYQATEADTYKIDTKKLINQGYDGVKLPGTGGFTIFDPSKIQTKSQLTDIWNKANNVSKPAKVNFSKEGFPTSNIVPPEARIKAEPKAKENQPGFNIKEKFAGQSPEKITSEFGKDVKNYQNTGISHAGDIQPENASLTRLKEWATVPEVQAKTKADLAKTIKSKGITLNKDGSITVYRAGDVPTDGRLVSVGYTKDAVERFVQENLSDKSTPVTEIKISPDQVKVFIGGGEKELLIEPRGSKESGIAKSIEAKAIEAKLTKGYDKVAGYDPLTFKEQAGKAADLINSGIDNAREVIRGEKPLPDGLRGTALIAGMEEYLKAHPDPALVEELANSPLISGNSAAAQELGLSRMREQDSATAKLQEIKKARIEKTGGDKAVESARKNLKASVKKVNLTKEELSWNNFLENIKC